MIMLILFFCPLSIFSAISFTSGPAETPDGNQVRIAFTVSGYTDVTVEVLDSAGAIIRHLGSGMLGSNPPLPFQADSLSQTVYWDNKDDRGNPFTGAHDIKVGLGLTASFDRIYGLSEYAWKGSAIESFATDTSGTVYMICDQWAYGPQGFNLFALDQNANYLKTVSPYPSNLPEERVKGFGRTLRPDGRSIPRVYEAHQGTVAPAMNAPRRQDFAITPQGWILMVNGSMQMEGTKDQEIHGERIVIIGTDGSCPFDTCYGPMLDTATNGVDYFIAASPDGKYVYASGDGPWVYRAPVNSLAQAPKWINSSMTSPCGLETDNQGRLYVCDWFADQVKIFDSTGLPIKSFSVSRPRNIKVNRNNGQIYILSCDTSASFAPHLLKYGALPSCDSISSFDDIRGRVSDVPITMVPDALPKRRNAPSFTLLLKNGNNPIIWALGNSNFIEVIEDQGPSFSFKAWKSPPATSPFIHQMLNPGPISVDPKEKFMYAGCSNFARIDLQTGVITNSSIHAAELCFGPDGTIYATGSRGGQNDSTVARFDRNEAPIAFPSGNMTEQGPHQDFISTADGTKGFQVTEKGDFYFCHRIASADAEICLYDSLFHLINSKIVDMPYSGGGVAVDNSGNIFTSLNVYPKSMPWPNGNDGFSMDFTGYANINPYLFGAGCIFKFPPSGGYVRRLQSVTYPATVFSSIPAGNLNGMNVPAVQTNGFGLQSYSVQGPVWQYFGISPCPISEVSQGDRFIGCGPMCTCYSPRFSVDGHGRVILPDAMNFSIVILDNNKNEMLRFGDYGNPDQTGPGSVVPSPDIPMTYPWYVASVNDHVYICDALAGRIIRAKLGYQQWATTQGHVASERNPIARNFTFRVYPTPFNPSVNIELSLFARQDVRISIYDAGGRLVSEVCKTKAYAPGQRIFSWDGKDQRGTSVGSGLYVAQIKAGNRIQQKNVLLIK